MRIIIFHFCFFLLARAKRIIPALITVILITLAAGYVLFEPLSYQLAGKHALSSLLFLSNITYANEAGYFDSDSLNKIFLHTWSLSVEWQFYILYPIVLLLLSRLISIHKLKKIVLFSAIFSFVFCIYFSFKDKTLSYFMIYTRGWEMLAGGIAFLFPLSVTENKKQIIEILGLILITSSFFIFSDTDTWPSYNALLPVLGAYLCILANSSKTLLSNAILQKIGLWSYSIYLIHWPLIVFLNKLDMDISIFAYLIFTLLLTFTVYNTVEKRRSYHYGLLLCWMVALCISYYISIDGVGKRVDEKYRLNKEQFHEKYFGGSGINQGSIVQKFNMIENETPDFIISGDSFMRQYMNSINSNKIKSIAIFKDGCFITPSLISKRDDFNNERCEMRYDNFILTMKKFPKTNVIFAQSWNSYTLTDRKTDKKINDNIDKTISNDINKLIKIGGNNRHYYIIGRPQNSKVATFECLARHNLPIWKITSACDKYMDQKILSINEEMKKSLANKKNVTFIDPNNILCEDGKCLLLNNDNEPIYSDNSHMTIFGSDIVINYFLNQK
ncbi:acyltransferase family protein [Morganella psychrotolerans]|nr:acyltransferase family protein [Morganella psychrotolerans]